MSNFTKRAVTSLLCEQVYRRDKTDAPIDNKIIEDITGIEISSPGGRYNNLASDKLASALNNKYSIYSDGFIYALDNAETGGVDNGFVARVVEGSDGNVYLTFRGSDLAKSFGSAVPAIISGILSAKAGGITEAQPAEYQSASREQDYADWYWNGAHGTGTIDRNAQIFNALEVVEAVRNAVGDDRKIIVTGQSLGGGLAGVVGAVTGLETITYAAAFFGKQIETIAGLNAAEKLISTYGDDAFSDQFKALPDQHAKNAVFRGFMGGFIPEDFLGLFPNGVSDARGLLSERSGLLLNEIKAEYSIEYEALIDNYNENVAHSQTSIRNSNEILSRDAISYTIESAETLLFGQGAKYIVDLEKDIVNDFGNLKFNLPVASANAAVIFHSPTLHAIATLTHAAPGRRFEDLYANDEAFWDAMVVNTGIPGAESNARADPIDVSSRMKDSGPAVTILQRALMHTIEVSADGKIIDPDGDNLYNYFYRVFGEMLREGTAAKGLKVATGDASGSDQLSIHAGLVEIGLQILRDATEIAGNAEGADYVTNLKKAIGESLGHVATGAETHEFAGNLENAVAYNVSGINLEWGGEHASSYVEELHDRTQAYGVNDIEFEVINQLSEAIASQYEVDQIKTTFSEWIEGVGTLASFAGNDALIHNAVKEGYLYLKNGWEIVVAQAGKDGVGLSFDAQSSYSSGSSWTNKSHLIFGGASVDDIKATNQSDVILGYDGADTIDARDGDDLILGGKGADTFIGGLGKDLIFGGNDDSETDTVDFSKSGESLKAELRSEGDDKSVHLTNRVGEALIDTQVRSTEEILLSDEIDVIDVQNLDALTHQYETTIDAGGLSIDRDELNLGKIGSGLKISGDLAQGISVEDTNTVFKSIGHLTLTQQDDVVDVTGVGSEIFLGDGNDYLKGGGRGTVIHSGPGGAGDSDILDVTKGVFVTDADSHDRVLFNRIDTAGTYFTWGGSEAQYATGKSGLLKVGFNPNGSLLIGDAFSSEGDAASFVYLANGNGNPLAPSDQLTAGIRVGAGELHVGHLLDRIWESISLAGRQAFWEFLRIVIKEFKGQDYTGGADPLVLDLDGDGLELTAMATSVSPMFDIDGDGFLEYTGWVSPDDGMLALDSNANGKIDDVGELFGGPGASGFAELATHDDNEDGVINAEDAIFGDLRVWRDLDRDGETDEGELFGLAELGIASIDAAGVEDGTRNSLNIVMRSGSFTRDDGTTGQVGDIEFQLNNFDTVFAGDTTVSQDVKDTMPNLKGHGTLADLHVSIMHDGLDGNLATTIRSVLPTMTEVDFGDLSAKALTILEAWAAAPPGEPIVGNNPDVPVLLKRDSGNLSVLDFAVEVTEDVTVTNDEGVETVVEKTFWKLASGRTVTNGEGQEIEFPTFDDVMAQIAETEGAAWEIVTGAEIDYLERYIGEEIPVEDPGILDANGISALNNLLETTRRVMDQQALRLAMQGGLEEYFDGVEYSVDEDKFVATSAAELIPFFEKVFEAAPDDADGAQEWLDAWKPLIDALLSDYDRPGISQLSKPFLFTNIVTAFENVGLSISLADAAETLGIPKELVDYGSGSRVGSSEGNIYYMSSGDDVVESKDGPDVFVFGRDFGHDVIDDFKEFGDDFDVIRFAHLTPADITAVRDGRDLILTVTATGDSIRVVEQFYEKAYALGGGNVLPTRGVNEIVFADGSVWTPSDIAVAVSNPTDADQTIIGTDHLDYLDGGAGNDFLSGAEGIDIYKFDVGYGHDTIEDNNEIILSGMEDILRFGESVRYEDLTVIREGFSNDVTFALSSGDTLKISGQFSATYPGVFDKLYFDQIEYFQFTNSEDEEKSFTADDLMDRILEEASTDGDDTIYGFDRDDRLDGGKGNDLLVGGNDSDTYIYDLGYGHDIAKEEVTPSDLRVLSGQDDKVLFGTGIEASTVRLERDGDSNNVVFHFSDGGTLTIEGQFFANNLGSRLYEIKQFIFSDGTEWSVKDLELQLLASDEADNTLYGFHGSDVLDGGAGNDYLNGLDGDDTYHFGYGYGQDVIYDETVSVFSGDADKLLFGEGITASDLTWSRPDNGNDLVATLSDGSSVRIQSQFFANNLGTRLHDIEIFEFSDGSTTTIEEIQKSLLIGDDGDNALIGFHSHDVLDGGAGNDYLNGKDGDDTYHFGYGYGQDVIYDETVSVFSGDADKLLFGEGITASDVIWSRPDNGNDLVATLSDGSSVRIQSQFFTNSLGGRLHDIEIFEFSDGSTISVANIQNLLLRGTSGDDTLVGFAYSDELRGGEGDDVLNGGRGDDVYVYARGDGHDTIIEETFEGDEDTVSFVDLNHTDVTWRRDGDDLIIEISESTTGSGDGGSIRIQNTLNNRLYKGVENVVFQDGSAWRLDDIREHLLDQYSTDGNDIIDGFLSADVITGGQGDDTLAGHGASDEYRYARGDGNDVIFEEIYEGYTDFLNLTDILPSEVKILRDGNNFIIEINESSENAGDSGSITIMNSVSGRYYGGVEELHFADGTIWSHQDILDNSIELPVGRTFRGTDGEDSIEGTVGDDVLYGLKGDDNLSGGQGSDIYVYNRGDGADVIDENEDAGFDTLKFSDINASDIRVARSFVDLSDIEFLVTATDGSVKLDNQLRQSSGVERIEFADGTVWGGSDFSLDSYLTSISVIYGTDGDDRIYGSIHSDDTLDGGAGDDWLAGEEGGDTYIYGTGSGNDFINEKSADSGSYDTLKLVGLNISDVRFERSFTDLSDVIVRITSSGETMTLDNQFDREDGVERIEFADGTVWGGSDFSLDTYLTSVAVIYGTANDDTMTGTSGNDTFGQTLGSDTLDGAAGEDTIVLTGERKDYEFSQSETSNVFEIVDLRTEQNGTFDIDLVKNFENVSIGGVVYKLSELLNDAPKQVTELTDQTILEDGNWSYSLPDELFWDPDGDELALTVSTPDGESLPTWLSFNAENGLFSGTPPQDFNGSLEIRVTASDGEYSVSDTFSLKIAPVNDAPIVSVPLEDKSSDEDAAVSFTLPSDAFTDVDGDTLTLTATLADGSALPAWLAFDAGTRTFSGTPPQDFNGVLNVSVVASDGALSTSDTFELEITPVNDAPILAEALEDQSGTEDTVASFVLPEDAFTDVDGDTLTLSATQADGSDLPGWLSFDPQTRAFSGTPPLNFNGSLDITVTASDGELSASDTFRLEFEAVNDAPIISVPIEDKSSDEDAVVSFTLPSDAFTDVDGDTLTFTATMADGSALPAWLAFDAGTKTFSGTPPQDFNGVLNVSVVASDGALSASDSFELEITPVNDAPILAEALEDQSGTEDTAVSFVLPEDAFSDVDGDTLSLSARLEDGSELPDWLSFDADSRTFSGTPPQNYNGTIDITVTASDGVLEASDTFSLDIAAVNDAPTAIGEGGFVIASGTPTTFAASGLLANDVDVDGDTLTITSVSSTSGNATVELDANGNVVYTAASGFDGEDSFTYTISDGEFTATAEVMLVVEADDPYEGWEQGTDGRDWMFGNLWSSNQIYGAGGNDIIVGGFYGDQLAGGTGNDRIWGNWGNDELHGNDGRDKLFGGFGNDTLSGGAGNDRLWGGWGRDNFVYEAGDGRDKIMDFETGHHWGWFRSRGDTISIDVDGIDSFADLMGTASQDGRNVVFDFGNGDELILSCTRLAALDKDAFTFY